MIENKGDSKSQLNEEMELSSSNCNFTTDLEIS